MATQKLIANERFYYGGRNVEMGEEFDAEEVDVALLTHAVKPMAKVMEAEPKPGREKPGREKADELGRTEKPEPETQAERRTYRRRDMKAED